MATKKINFEEVTLRLDVSYRGGGIEIDLTPFGFKGEKMAAYQNYLGGGMLGSVCVNDTITAYNKSCTEKKLQKLNKIGEDLKKYFHSLTCRDEDSWEFQNYEQNQNMPESAY